MPLVILVRHGEAIEPGTRGVFKDKDRMLTEEGVKKMKGAAKGFAKLDLSVNKILTSGFLRADQTAEIYMKALGHSSKPTVNPDLIPDADPGKMLYWLQNNPAKVTMLVGHNPHLQKLSDLLLGTNPRSGVVFRKGSACALYFKGRVEERRGILLWHMPSRLLRMLSADSSEIAKKPTIVIPERLK